MATTLKITNDKGRPFLVRIVDEGDRYGRDDCIVYDAKHDMLFRKHDPMVEFYDLSADPKKFGERGQFVSRYYASTFATVKDGLCLDGGNASVWSIDAAALVPVHEVLDRFLTSHKA